METGIFEGYRSLMKLNDHLQEYEGQWTREVRFLLQKLLKTMAQFESIRSSEGYDYVLHHVVEWEVWITRLTILSEKLLGDLELQEPEWRELRERICEAHQQLETAWKQIEEFESISSAVALGSDRCTISDIDAYLRAVITHEGPKVIQ